MKEEILGQSLSLVEAFCDKMEGEKDPRCLLLYAFVHVWQQLTAVTLCRVLTRDYHHCRCLKTCTRLLRDFVPKGETNVAAEAAEAVFKKASLYYPITFTPPPNDPYRISPVSPPRHA